MTQTKVPFIDLSPQHAPLQEEFQQAAARIFANQRFIMGEEGRALEEELANYVGVKHAIGCASGSDALLLALRALNVDGEQAVVTTPQTFFATAGAPARLGCQIDFVDVEPETLNLDPVSLERFLASCSTDADGVLREPKKGKRLTTLIAVDLFGRPCRYEQLEELCFRHRLALIEDAAQAIGGGIGARRCGSFGRVGTFSFYPTKNLGGAGDGGLVTTDDDDLAARIRRLRVHGQSSGRYFHGEIGWNSRLDELQAAVLRVKLPHLDAWNQARRDHARAYDEGLASIKGIRPLAPAAEGNTLVHHLYVVRAERRDALRDHLQAAGVGCAVYYPEPLHLQECFQGMGYRAGDLPHAEAASAEVLALPMYAELPQAARERVIEEIRRFYG